jgi:hypothetical protein
MAKLVTFRKALDYCSWEIVSKTSLLKAFVSKTNSLKKAIVVANTIRRMKKVWILFYV